MRERTLSSVQNRLFCTSKIKTTWDVLVQYQISSKQVAVFITELQNSWGWKGFLEITWSIPLSRQGHVMQDTLWYLFVFFWTVETKIEDYTPDVASHHPWPAGHTLPNILQDTIGHWLSWLQGHCWLMDFSSTNTVLPGPSQQSWSPLGQPPACSDTRVYSSPDAGLYTFLYWTSVSFSSPSYPSYLSYQGPTEGQHSLQVCQALPPVSHHQKSYLRTFYLFNQVVDKLIKWGWTQFWSLGNVIDCKTPSGFCCTHQNTLISAIQVMIWWWNYHRHLIISITGWSL